MEIWVSMLLLGICGIAVALGTYFIQGTLDRRIRRIFLALCAAVMVWSFGQAVAAGAREETVSVLGLRLANLGWDVTACIILTFLMELTGSLPPVKKWRMWLPAYFPSALHLLGFSVLPFWGVNSETMRRTAFGWAGVVSPHNAWVWGYFFQPLAFLAMGIWLLIRWIGRAESRAVKKQAMILIAAFLITAVLSVASDFLPVATGVSIPRISAAFMLIPMFAVTYLFHRYHFLQIQEESGGLILTEIRTHRYIYFLISMIFAALILLIPAFSFCLPSLIPMLPIDLCLLVLLSCLVIIDRVRMSSRLRELTVAMCLSFVTSIAALWSVHTDNPTAWTFVFIFMMVSLLFNWLIVLSSVVVSAFLSQMFIWSYQPVAHMEISGFVYTVRFVALTVIAAFAVYDHRIYVRRLKENANHLVKQTLVAEISHSFVSCGKDNIEEKLRAMLECCGRFLRCDRAYLLLPDADGKLPRSFEWLAEGIPSGIRDFEALLPQLKPMIRRQAEKRGMAILRDAVLLLPPARQVRKELLRQGIRACVTIPLKSGDEDVGFLGFHAAAPLRKWNLEDPSFLQVIAGISTDAFLKVRAEEKVNFIAYHDQLTGLPNRMLFNDRLSQAIPMAERTEKMLAVVFVDLDSFKSVNDTMGHHVGDQLLVAVAHILTGAVRSYDTVSRFGGDEFILFLNQLSDTADLTRILSKLTETLQAPFALNGQEVFITASIGAALYPQDGEDAETLVKNADTAMYRAKEQGKNRYALCSQSLKSEILEKVKLTNLLYRALEKDQLLLYYQPQVDTATHSITGCEALARWNLPGRGIVMPAEFIPLAEQTGLIQPIGAWVLKTACRQNQEWHKLGFSNLRMAVNVSTQQLQNPKFIQQVKDTLDCTALPPQYLDLEISENVASENIDNIVELLNGLKALGVTISIDDFGTKYSSISRLKNLPVDRIKMDMQFVQGIETNEKDQAISKVIITLAKNFQLKVIAEGVETKPQLDFLSQRMCDEVQGFYYYRPMPAEQVEAVLRRGGKR